MEEHVGPSVRMTRPGTRSRKVRAVLAGGLVLGLGATITLAAWNDSEFASGTFTAGHFDLKGSTDGTTFADHASGSPASLTFSLGYNLLTPNDTVAAPFVLHLDKDTTSAAVGTVASATRSGTAATQLTYGIRSVASVAACTPTATGTAIVPAGTALNSATGASSFSLTQSSNLGTDPGADVFLCIQVTASATIVQDTGAVGTWQFLATSV